MNWLGYLLVAVLLLGAAVYFGLPPTLRAMGLHQHYEIPDFNLEGRRALVVTTSHPTLGETGRPTGVFGSEMTVPYYAFLDAGLEVDIASIRGGAVPVQPWSMSWPLATHDDRRFLGDADAMGKLRASIPITGVRAEDYDVIFMAGGWGAAYDLAQSAELATLISQAHEDGRIIGSVCHGALGLVSATNPDGSPLVQGRRVTGVTDLQIEQFGITITPKHPESELRAAGAIFEAQTAWRDFFATHTVVDGNLVTGQNQNSGYETAHRILERLEAQPEDRTEAQP